MIDSGSVAWMIVASVLVLFMTPGVAFFYGGLVRGKNVISTMMYSFISMGVMMIIWVLYGYSLAFGTAADVTSAGFNNFIGNFDFAGFRDVSSSGLGLRADPVDSRATAFPSCCSRPFR